MGWNVTAKSQFSFFTKADNNQTFDSNNRLNTIKICKQPTSQFSESRNIIEYENRETIQPHGTFYFFPLPKLLLKYHLYSLLYSIKVFWFVKAT